MPPPSAPSEFQHCRYWQWNACVSFHIGITIRSATQMFLPADMIEVAKRQLSNYDDEPNLNN